ncbi:MAG: 2-amino-4-hydroxy-6-hydroxymethyldihydropteridine diphosphokinase [Anaerolineaceae bacterium]
MKHRIYLSFGSNLGNRQENLLCAYDLLAPEVRLIRTSSIYETAPWGYLEQPAFLNCVVEAKTNLSPTALLVKLKGIETELGRQPTFRNGPRLIDIDILLYDKMVISSDEITIPHPRMLERAFVLVPLAEIAGDLQYSPTGETINSLLEGIDKKGVERYNPKGKAKES